MMEAAIYQLVTTDSGFAAVCGNRFYPAILTDPPIYPAASFRRISTRREYTLDGTYIAWARLQIDCWGATMTDALAASDALETLLDGYDGSVGGTVISNIVPADQSSGFDSVQRAYYVQTDWMITFYPA